MHLSPTVGQLRPEYLSDFSDWKWITRNRTHQGASVPSRLQAHLAGKWPVVQNLDSGFIVDYLHTGTLLSISVIQ